MDMSNSPHLSTDELCGNEQNTTKHTEHRRPTNVAPTLLNPGYGHVTPIPLASGAKRGCALYATHMGTAPLPKRWGKIKKKKK